MLGVSEGMFQPFLRFWPHKISQERDEPDYVSTLLEILGATDVARSTLLRDVVSTLLEILARNDQPHVLFAVDRNKFQPFLRFWRYFYIDERLLPQICFNPS